MKKLLNTLYITSKKAYLSREGENVKVLLDQQQKHFFPIHILESIVCFGNAMCSPSLMHLCSVNKVSISFLNEYGRFLAKVQGPVSGNVLLRREQYRKADDEIYSLAIARSFVLGKLVNSRTVLMRAAREISKLETVASLRKISSHLSYLVQNLRKVDNIDSLRGIEGEASKAYFSAFDHLILTQKDHFFFNERSRRPPLDNMNALLSFIYTLLVHDMTSALETVGVDPAVGFLHKDRPGRPSLSLDMIEEYRSFLADRLALTLINKLQIRPQGFHSSPSGEIKMEDDTRKQVLAAYQKLKQETIQHPFIGEKVQIGLIPHIQAALLSRYIRGDLDGYPPFIWRS